MKISAANQLRKRVAATVLSGAALLSLSILRGDEKAPQDPKAPVSDPRVTITPRAPKPVPGAKEERRSPNIRIDTNLVQINVTVTTPLGQVVTAM